MKEVVNNLLDAADADRKVEKAKEMFKTDNPTEEQLNQAYRKLADEACMIFDKPEFRNRLVEIKRKNEQIIDTVSKDDVIFAGFDQKAKEKALNILDTFKQFIEDNKDELTALQLI